MNEQVLQIIGLILLIIYEVYVLHSGDAPVLARFWDFVARVAGAVANYFGRIAVRARLSYFEVIQ